MFMNCEVELFVRIVFPELAWRDFELFHEKGKVNANLDTSGMLRILIFYEALCFKLRGSLKFFIFGF